MMTIIIELVADATTGELFAEPTYLEDMDFERDSIAGAKLTRHKRKAKQFPSAAAALEYWRTQSKTHPIRRSDGKPNRPLTGWSITFVTLDERTPK
jgi:hypothetical protein